MAQAVVFVAAMALSVVAALALPSVWLSQEPPPRLADTAKEAAGMLPARALAGEFAVLDGTLSGGR
ncbi:hypothetical protein GCM10027034_36690 [Ramlibacter solisilvae]|uniref:Uncharacterized protein n=2 Tax=Ramlibacter tataouinensis TaxID=94132 RepID=A0A127JUN9_9BURK|nr:hypothetical protein UC35_13630 [Ramlibacter tataouinensis]